MFVLLFAFVLFQRGLKGWSILLTGLLIIQVGLGVANVVLGLPLANAVLHNLFGALLTIAVTSITYLLHRKEVAYG